MTSFQYITTTEQKNAYTPYLTHFGRIAIPPASSFSRNPVHLRFRVWKYDQNTTASKTLISNNYTPPPPPPRTLIHPQVITQRLIPPPTSTNTNTNTNTSEFEPPPPVFNWDRLTEHGYKYISVLSKSMMGEVVLAMSYQSGVHFAIKRYNVTHAKAKEHKHNEQIDMEIKMLTILKCTTGVPYLYTHFTIDDNVFLVQEMLQGMELFHYVKEHVSINSRNKSIGSMLLLLLFNESYLRHIFSQMCLLIHSLHSRCIAHGDISLENWFIHEKGFQIANMYLIDFGGCRDYSTKEDKPDGRLTGKPYYIAPESMKHNRIIDPFKHDIFALGVCFFRIATGQELILPLEHNNYFFPGSSLPLLLQDLLRKMLCNDYEKRANIYEIMHHKWLMVPSLPLFVNNKQSIIH